MERGTLFQVLHCTSISSDPGKNKKASEEFLYIVLSTCIVAAEKVEEMSQNLLTAKEVSNKVSKFLSIENHVDQASTEDNDLTEGTNVYMDDEGDSDANEDGNDINKDDTNCD